MRYIKKKIYLAGGMSNVSYDEQMEWRENIQDELEQAHYDVEVINPVCYYNFENDFYKSEREVFEFDTYHLRTSDVVIVNFNEPKSIGTAMELMLAKETRIPVIGINENNQRLHPWLLECVTRMCDNIYDAVEYVKVYFL